MIRIGWYDGDREALRPLFGEADDSATQIESYLHAGRVLGAWHNDELIGHAQILDGGDGVVELKSMAVVDHMRGRNVGRALVEEALAVASRGGAHRMLVATAAADIGNLRFYQRCGFRFAAVERDAFTPVTGYPEQEVIDGIPLRDRVWFDHPLCAGAFG